jgi:RNA polymerase sigma-70 factor (ECF subfamily)
MYTNNTNEQTNNACQNTLAVENSTTLNPSVNTPLTSQELEALRDGCHKAYRKLFLQFVKPLIRYITMITRSEELAEELTQEILATVWINRQKIDPAKNIKGYLFTVARNTITDHYRKQKVRESYMNQQSGMEYITHSTDAPMIAKDLERHVVSVVSQMPKQRRKIFELSYKNGWSSGEIADHLGLNKKAVEKQISYARKSIRERIAIA